MYKISTLNKISQVGLNQFDERYMIIDKAEEANGILVRSQDMHSMEFSENLLAIARAGAGVNNIPLDACAEKGIVVFNTPGANANAVKELVISGLFLAARNISKALAWASSLTENVSAAVEKGKSQFAGTEILGKTLGVVGLGAIGRKVANAASALGMRVVGYDPYFSGEIDGVEIFDTVEAMLPVCDYVTIHVPATDSTKGMFNKDLFAVMKENATLLNFSRDKLVNDGDLIAALDGGKLGCYVTDFPNDNLIGQDKIILLPHLGASTEEAEDNCASMAANQMRDYFENGNIKNSVNFPAVNLGPIGDNVRFALCVKGEDTVNMLLETKEFADRKVLKSAGAVKGEYGYVLMELDATTAPSIMLYGTHANNIIKYRSIAK